MNTNDVLVKMVLDRWYASVRNYDDLLHSLTDEQLQQEIAPGRNRGIYLLGHLIAVHDDMLPLLNLGEKRYALLNKVFFDAADKTVSEIPSAGELRAIWKEQNEDLKRKFDSLSPDDWFDRHTVVSAEDFRKEPHRNRLNIIITRTSHLQYHIGQMRLLK